MHGPSARRILLPRRIGRGQESQEIGLLHDRNRNAGILRIDGGPGGIADQLGRELHRESAEFFVRFEEVVRHRPRRCVRLFRPGRNRHLGSGRKALVVDKSFGNARRFHDELRILQHGTVHHDLHVICYRIFVDDRTVDEVAFESHGIALDAHERRDSDIGSLFDHHLRLAVHHGNLRTARFDHTHAQLVGHRPEHILHEVVVLLDHPYRDCRRSAAGGNHQLARADLDQLGRYIGDNRFYANDRLFGAGLRKGNGILARKRTGEIQHAFIIVSSRESRHPVRSTGDRCADRRFGVARQIDLLVGAAAGEERCTAREGEKQCIFIHVFHRLLFFG